MHKKESKQHFAHSIASITVTNNRSLAPYIDVFAVTPQNIIEREHGSLVGFFRIYDESDESAYIANFLTSVLKKEFYASTRRDTESALEVALTKVNMALGELARHDSTQWIGKVDGAVCAFTNTSVCFSSCGDGAIHLFRNGTLTRISAPSHDTSENILSTFSDIACGPLHAGDTFLIASRECAEILPHKECERACTRYTGTDREQLFRTALVNKSDGSCVHIVEITPARSALTRRAAAFDVGEEPITIPENVFSAKTFAEKTQEETRASTEPEEDSKHKIVDAAPNHIYLQGDETDTRRTPFSDILREHTASLRSTLRRNIATSTQNIRKATHTFRHKNAEHFHAAKKRTASVARTSFLAALTQARQYAQRSRTLIARASAHITQRVEVLRTQRSAKNVEQGTRQQPKPAPLSHTSTVHSTINTPTIVHDEVSKAPRNETEQKPRTKHSFTHSATPLVTRDTPQKKTSIDHFLAHGTTDANNTSTERSQHSPEIAIILGKVTECVGAHTRHFFARGYNMAQTLPRSIFRTTETLLPHPQRIVAYLRALSPRERIIAASIIAMIIFAPLVISRISTPSTHVVTPQQQQEQQSAQSASDIPTDSESTPIKRTYTIHSDGAIHTLIDLRGETYIIAPREIVHITNATSKKTYSLPQNYKAIVEAVAMDDLNMIILRTSDNTIISFTPQGTEKFTKNAITFPAGLSIDAMSTYMTYLYFFDSNGNDIYRYPRITGGFGAAVNWLTDRTQFNAPRATVIDGSIYIAQENGEILTLFKHKKTAFPTPSLTPQLHADALFTAKEDAPLFILDRAAKRIVAIDKKNGAVLHNVSNKDFTNAHSIIVNERLSTITVLLDDGTVATYRY